MKLILVAFFFLPSALLAAVPPDQQTVDQYVVLASKLSVEEIQGKGNISCKYTMSNNFYGKDADYIGRGKKMDEAQTRLALACIKERCKQVGLWIQGALGQVIDSAGDENNAEFLKTQGYSESEIATILQNRRTMDRSHLTNITCENSTPLGRMVIVDSCFTVPMQCQGR